MICSFMEGLAVFVPDITCSEEVRVPAFSGLDSKLHCLGKDAPDELVKVVARKALVKSTISFEGRERKMARGTEPKDAEYRIWGSCIEP